MDVSSAGSDGSMLSSDVRRWKPGFIESSMVRASSRGETTPASGLGSTAMTRVPAVVGNESNADGGRLVEMALPDVLNNPGPVETTPATKPAIAPSPSSLGKRIRPLFDSEMPPDAERKADPRRSEVDDDNTVEEVRLALSGAAGLRQADVTGTPDGTASLAAKWFP